MRYELFRERNSRVSKFKSSEGKIVEVGCSFFDRDGDMPEEVVKDQLVQKLKSELYNFIIFEREHIYRDSTLYKGKLYIVDLKSSLRKE